MMMKGYSYVGSYGVLEVSVDYSAETGVSVVNMPGYTQSFEKMVCFMDFVKLVGQNNSGLFRAMYNEMGKGSPFRGIFHYENNFRAEVVSLPEGKTAVQIFKFDAEVFNEVVSISFLSQADIIATVESTIKYISTHAA